MVSQERGTGRSRTSTSSARGRLAHATPSSWRSREDSGTAESFITQHTLSQGAPIRGQGFTPQTTGLLAMLSLFYRTHVDPPTARMLPPLRHYSSTNVHGRASGERLPSQSQVSVRHGTPSAPALALHAPPTRAPPPPRVLWDRSCTSGDHAPVCARVARPPRPVPTCARGASASLGARLSDGAHSGPHDR